MDFMGKICPYCKSEFKEDDDVVICSVCEMPHHKECWIENKACSTFGCTGTNMSAVSDGNSNRLLCTKCGSAYKEGDKFCSTCGNIILKSEQQEQCTFVSTQEQSFNYNESQNINQATVNTDEDILTFIGKNQEYYFNKFQKFNLNNSKVSWNWASAFLGAYWYAYRKMFLFQFLYYVIYLFGTFFIGMLIGGVFIVTRNTNHALLAMFPLLVLFGPFLISGMFGNIIYKYHVEQHLKKAGYMDAYMKQNYLIKKGGTSGIAVLVLIGISLLLRVLGNL
ncbi:RING finger protein [Clostridium sp.]|uniref:RING finger protein n=1 Tax=Clostridium sp. TaxID=1506 RepID=UPI0026182548|nr:RING finger protein [Clostridium sp.]